MSFEAIQQDLPPPRIAENLVRLLNYEPELGLNDAVDVIVKSAGCTALISTNTDDVMQQCIMNEHPANFPLKDAKFYVKVSHVFTLVSNHMKNTGDPLVIGQLGEILAKLMGCELLSMRFCAVKISTFFLYLDEVYNALLKRCTDVNTEIRKTSLLSTKDSKELEKALQDESPQIRHDVVLWVRNGDIPLSEAADDRLYEMALCDVDLKVRKECLRYLAQKGVVSEDVSGMVKMLFDLDNDSRILAAEIIMIKLVSDDSTPEQVLLALANYTQMNSDASKSVAQALKQYKLPFAETCGHILAMPSKHKLKNVNTHRSLMLIFKHLVNKQLVNLVPQILKSASFNDTLLADALSAVKLDYNAIASGSQEKEELARNVENTVVDIFQTRDNSDILREAASVLSMMPLSTKVKLKSTVYQPLRVQLGDLLGPAKHKSKMETLRKVALKLIQFAQVCDISDLLKLPLFSNLENGYVRNLVRAIGMTTSEPNVINTIVEKLSASDVKPVDDILRVCISAKMRDIEIIPFPLDVNEYQAKDENVWRAAVAAEVI